MREVSFFLRPAHNEQVAKILADPEASQNDKGVALAFLKNAEIAAKGELPICQDTGTATIVGKKGQQVWTGVKDEEFLSEGVYETYTEENLRYSQTAALDMYEEVNTGTNLPAQIDLYATEGARVQVPLRREGRRLGEQDLALAGDEGAPQPGDPREVPRRQDEVPRHGRVPAVPPRGRHRRHLGRGLPEDGEARLDEVLRRAPDEGERARRRVPRPRARGSSSSRRRTSSASARSSAASTSRTTSASSGCRATARPARSAMGVSCSADRNVKAKINRDGLWLEELDHAPERLIPRAVQGRGEARRTASQIDLNRPMKEILAELSKHPVSTPLLLTGTIVVGARHRPREVQGDPRRRARRCPSTCSSTRSTTRARRRRPRARPPARSARRPPAAWTRYVDLLQSKGASLMMIAKGNRSQQVTDACKKYGGFYLGSIGGPAALLAEENIKKVECIDFPELGMEAVWKIDVVDFPAFILVDDKGNDFFKKLGV